MYQEAPRVKKAKTVKSVVFVELVPSPYARFWPYSGRSLTALDTEF